MHIASQRAGGLANSHLVSLNMAEYLLLIKTGWIHMLKISCKMTKAMFGPPVV